MSKSKAFTFEVLGSSWYYSCSEPTVKGMLQSDSHLAVSSDYWVVLQICRIFHHWWDLGFRHPLPVWAQNSFVLHRSETYKKRLQWPPKVFQMALLERPYSLGAPDSSTPPRTSRTLTLFPGILARLNSWTSQVGATKVLPHQGRNHLLCTPWSQKLSCTESFRKDGHAQVGTDFVMG